MSEAREHLAAILTSIYRDGGYEYDLTSAPDASLINVADAMGAWAKESPKVQAEMRRAADNLLRALGLVAVAPELVERVQEARRSYVHRRGGTLSTIAHAKGLLADSILEQLGGGR